MRFREIKIEKSRTIKLSDSRSESLSIGSTIELSEDEDNPQEIIEIAHRLLTQELNGWEHEIRQDSLGERLLSAEPPPITTAAQMVDKLSENVSKAQDTIAPEHELEISETIKCPKCGEPMYKKDGKKYYQCTKHWAYPDMLKKGEARDKTK